MALSKRKRAAYFRYAQYTLILVVVAAIVLIAASTGFYFVASKLPGGTDTPAQIDADIQQTAPTQP